MRIDLILTINSQLEALKELKVLVKEERAEGFPLGPRYIEALNTMEQAFSDKGEDSESFVGELFENSIDIPEHIGLKLAVGDYVYYPSYTNEKEHLIASLFYIKMSDHVVIRERIFGGENLTLVVDFKDPEY